MKTSILSFLLLASAVLLYGADKDFEMSLSFENAQVGELIIGCNAKATDGYDRGKDIYVPPMGMGTGIIGIKIPADKQNMLYKDIRSANLPQTWDIVVKPARKPIVIRWNTRDMPQTADFTVSLRDGKKLNMRSQQLLRIAAEDTATITVIPKPAEK